MKKIGIVGFSEGNGHPFSFSAIINGYDKFKFEKLGWKVIDNYLSERKQDEFGVADLSVTDIWLPEQSMAKSLADACYINRVHSTPFEMMDHIDGVMLLRDDWESHKLIAEPFLASDIPTFIDKPLTLDKAELNWFEPFMRKGKLFSCAPFKFSEEIKEAKTDRENYGELLSINATVCGNWEKYGIHIIDSVFQIIGETPLFIEKYRIGGNDLRLIQLSNGANFTIQTHENMRPTFNINLFFQNGVLPVNITDNFSAFKNVIYLFNGMIDKDEAPFDPEETIRSITTLIEGH